MDAAPPPGDNARARAESAAEEQRRLAWEAEMIAEADAEIEAGLYVDSDEVDAWINSIGTDHELPPPATRRR
jgi:predicted transcriptional regulator